MAHHVQSILERSWEMRCLCTVVADYEPVNLYDNAAACVGCHTVPRGTTNAVYMCLPVDDAYMASPFRVLQDAVSFEGVLVYNCIPSSATAQLNLAWERLQNAMVVNEDTTIQHDRIVLASAEHSL